MIGSVFKKKEKISSSYPGVSKFSTNQNPAFYRCFQIIGAGMVVVESCKGKTRPRKVCRVIGVCCVCLCSVCVCFRFCLMYCWIYFHLLSVCCCCLLLLFFFPLLFFSFFSLFAGLLLLPFFVVDTVMLFLSHFWC